MTGRIIKFNEALRYGFIKSGTKRYFFHVSQLPEGRHGYVLPEEGAEVEFEEGRDDQGRKCAKNVRYVYV